MEAMSSHTSMMYMHTVLRLFVAPPANLEAITYHSYCDALFGSNGEESSCGSDMWADTTSTLDMTGEGTHQCRDCQGGRTRGHAHKVRDSSHSPIL